MHACLVYDAHEDYPAMMSLYLPQPAVAVLAWLESRLLRRTDHIITASSVLADKLRGRTAAPVTTLGNYQPLAPYDAVRPSDVATARSELGIPRDGLLVAYIGGFSRNRMLAPLLDAAQELSDVTVLIWGDGHQRPLVEARADQISNVRYLGWLPAAQVPLYMQVADVIYYCLLPDYPGAIYNAPNTLSQAMAAGRPIIANEVGDLGRIVGQTGCGLLVPEVTAAAIREAISTLRNPVLRQTLGQAGRAAAASHYNWEVAGQQLQGVYAGLLNEV
jgi:glycosyltransferase involved in cell wall biosynthesis